MSAQKSFDLDVEFLRKSEFQKLDDSFDLEIMRRKNKIKELKNRRIY